MTHSSDPRVAVVMGSHSDWEIMQHASRTLDDLGVAHWVRVLSAHRTPEPLVEFIQQAEQQGVRVFIAAAGMAAHLAGAVASRTLRPVLGVPMPGGSLHGFDALLSTVQMPAGVPVATLAIGKAGAVNAALLAAQILAVADERLHDVLLRRRERQAAQILSQPDPREA